MRITEAQTIGLIKTRIDEHRVCFLLGNGINLQFKKRNVFTWEYLIKQIARKFGYEYKDVSSLLPTEQYSAMVLKYGEQVIRTDAIKKIALDPEMDLVRFSIFNHKLELFDCPVLTTNFDSFLDNNSKCQAKKKESTDESVSTLDLYWGPRPLVDVSEGYGVWHIHGHHSLEKTIRLGLSDYGKLCSRIFDITNPWKEDRKTDTWLDPFLKKELCIIGLQLDEAEVFIRWLLLRKAHVKKSTSILGWYFYVPEKWYHRSKKKKQNKTLQFLEMVRITPIPISRFSKMYSLLFDV